MHGRTGLLPNGQDDDVPGSPGRGLTRAASSTGVSYTMKNLKRDVENAAPKFGMPDELQARFARGALEGETLGLSHVTLAPNFRIPFGHRHEGQEEVYVVVKGSARSRSRTRSSTSARGRDPLHSDTINVERGLTASSTSRSAPVRSARRRDGADW